MKLLKPIIREHKNLTMFIWSICYLNCSSIYVVNYKLITQQKNNNNKKNMYNLHTCIGDCWLPCFFSAFICYIMVVSISVDVIRQKPFLLKAVVILIFLLCSIKIYFKYVRTEIVIYYNMILPKNEFSHLKGFHEHPYLDIRTYPSQLTNRYLFSCVSMQYQEKLYNDQFLFSFQSTTLSSFIQ